MFGAASRVLKGDVNSRETRSYAFRNVASYREWRHSTIDYYSPKEYERISIKKEQQIV